MTLALSAARDPFATPSESDVLAWPRAALAAGAPAGAWARDIGGRRAQEDRLASSWREDGTGVLAVFDGHGLHGSGGAVAERLAADVGRALHAPVAAQARAAGRPPAQLDAAEMAYALVHGVAELQRLVADEVDGAVGVMALCDARHIWVANVGDARAVWLPTDGGPQRLSYDHRAHDAQEAALVVAQGGWLRRGRVGGELAVSRSFGDWQPHLRGIIRQPDITCTPLQRGGLLVLASDGIFDAVDERQLAALARAAATPLELVRALVAAAEAGGSADNKAAIAVALGPARHDAS